MARRVERRKAFKLGKEMEARAGIEPTYEDLQSSAWPLCHRAGSGRIRRVPTWRPCLASARIGPIRRGGQAWAEPALTRGGRVEFGCRGGYNRPGKIIGQAVELCGRTS